MRPQHLAIVTLTCMLLGSSRGLTIDFPDGLTYIDACSPGGSWGIHGHVTFRSEDNDFYQQQVIIQTNVTLCTLDLRACGKPQPNLTALSANCSCYNQGGGVFEISASRLMQASDAGQMVQVVVPATQDFYPVTSTSNIGVIPALHTSQSTFTYQFDDGSVNTLLATQTIPVCDMQYTQLKICSDNSSTQSGSVLDIVVLNQDIRSNETCVHITEQFDFTSVDSHQIAFMSHENHDTTCPFKKQFTINVEKSPLDQCQPMTSPPTLSTKAPTTQASNAVANTCYPTSTSTPRQLATLPNGVKVLCDTVTPSSPTTNGGWIVIQRRVTGNVDFYQPWDAYVNGFGNFSGDFWLGLEKIHDLCFITPCQLRFDVKYAGKDYYALYPNFRLFGNGSNYKMQVGTYSGTTGEDPSFGFSNHHNGHEFSTFDSDHDDDNGQNRCSTIRHAGWWFGHCGNVNLNGKWSTQGPSGMYWCPLTCRGGTHPVTFSEMKVLTTLPSP